MLTTSNSSRGASWQSAFSAPAVKAVWLPPPWQAIAILVLAIRRSLPRIVFSDPALAGQRLA